MSCILGSRPVEVRLYRVAVRRPRTRLVRVRLKTLGFVQLYPTLRDLLLLVVVLAIGTCTTSSNRRSSYLDRVQHTWADLCPTDQQQGPNGVERRLSVLASGDRVCNVQRQRDRAREHQLTTSWTQNLVGGAGECEVPDAEQETKDRQSVRQPCAPPGCSSPTPRLVHDEAALKHQLAGQTLSRSGEQVCMVPCRGHAKHGQHQQASG